MWKVRRSRGYGCKITGIAVRLMGPAGADFGCFGESCSATGGDFCCQRMGAGSEDAQRAGSAQCRLRLVWDPEGCVIANGIAPARHRVGRAMRRGGAVGGFPARGEAPRYSGDRDEAR